MPDQPANPALRHSRRTGAFYEYDPGTEEFQWSASSATTLGIPAVELPSCLDEWRSFVHPDDRSRVDRAFYALLMSDSPVAIEYRSFSALGDLRPIREEASRLPSGRIVGHVRPLEPHETDLLASFRRAESELKRFFELSIDLLCIAGMDGSFRRVNLSFTRVLGYTQEELIARSLLDLVHPEDRAVTQLEVRKLAAGAASVRFRNRLRDRNGDHRWVEWNALLTPEAGQFLAIARDITEQIAMERLLLSQEQRERALLDNTSAVIYIKKACGRYEFVNRAFLTLFRLSWDQVIGRTDYEIFPEPFATGFVKNDEEVIRTLTPITVEEAVPHPDGGFRTYVSIKIPLIDSTGEAVLAGVSTDITDQLRASQTEEELKLARIVQQRLYPSEFPDLPGFDLAGASLPMAHLCGDYFDYVLDESSNRLWLAVGDVSGHGLGPGLTMVEIRSLLRVLLPQNGDLSSTFRRVNRTLLVDSPEFFFVTLFVVEFDLTTRDAWYIGAGHDAWILRADGSRDWLDSNGPPLGLVDYDYEQIPLPGGLHTGDVLLLYTDGIPEAMSFAEKPFGRDRMVESVERQRAGDAKEIVNELFEEVQSFADRQLCDDITMIVLKVL